MGFLVFCLILGVLASSQAAVNRPCPTLSLDCVRNYLSSVSSCTPVTEVVGLDPYFHWADIIIPNPVINVTVNRYTNKFVGLSNASFVDLYVDTDEAKTVLVTHFPRYAGIGSGFAYYHRKGLLDITVQTSFEFPNEDATINTIFNGTENLSLDKAQVNGYVGVVKDYYIPEKFEGLAEAIKKYPYVAYVRNLTQAHLDVKFREDAEVVSKIVNNAYINKAVCTF